MAELPAPEPAWWQAANWNAPASSLSGEGLSADLYGDGRVRLRLIDPLLCESSRDGGEWEFRFLTAEGSGAVVTTAPGGGLPSSFPSGTGLSQPVSLMEEEGTLTLYLPGTPWGDEELFGVRVRATREGEETEDFFLAEGESLVRQRSSIPDFSQMMPRFRYLQQGTGEDRVYLFLYPDDSFLVTRREGAGEKNVLWGTWEDGNTAITLWPDEQCCGPEAEFRLEKTGGLRVYSGGGPASLPLAEGAAFQKIGDLLDLPAFDSAVVSMVVEGDRPALFLDREQDEALLGSFRGMMADAAQLRSPQWTEDPADRPNLQFDLNINGEDVTMVLCPCIVAGTEDKYLLVRKDSWMGRVTYTYYQTQQGNDYDRMVELFEARYAEDPQVLTAAMAAQTRAQTAAISNLDWSDEFPLDENGIPITYKAVLREQRATGYASLRNGQTWGAGSKVTQAKAGIYYCTAGTVAVRANEIPYGTKLYIRTPGGGFIYGYAIANDTGVGLVEGVIDVDLFYDSYQESVLNSVRWVDIYILD